MKLRKLQMGGPVEAPEAGAPVEGAQVEGGMPAEGGQDPLMQIAEMFMQGLQAQDCSMLAQGAQMFLELLQQAQGAQAQPVFGKGGKITSYRMVRK
jgi:hypothetical protein